MIENDQNSTPLLQKVTPLIRQQAKSNCKQYFVILLFGIHGNGLAWTWTWTCVHMDMDLHGHGHGLGCPNITVHPISQSSFSASQKKTWSLPPAQGSFEPPGGAWNPWRWASYDTHFERMYMCVYTWWRFRSVCAHRMNTHMYNACYWKLSAIPLGTCRAKMQNEKLLTSIKTLMG